MVSAQELALNSVSWSGLLKEVDLVLVLVLVSAPALVSALA